VWGVHAQQRKEQEVGPLSSTDYTDPPQTMYQGVVRDEARQAAKKKQRADELLESHRKRELYERVQSVSSP
jgi:protein PET117